MIRYCTYRNERIRFSDKGKGRVIVFLHGFLESLEIWDAMGEALSRRFRVICVDLPGHGGTGCFGYIHSMELMAKCVKAVLNQLGLRKCVMIGHSMGGYASLAFTELFPENIKGIGLFHSTPLADSAEKKRDRDRAIQAVKKDHRQYTGQLVEKLFAKDNLKKLRPRVKKIKSIAAGTSKRAVIAALEGMKERKNRETVLKETARPVLFIAGKKDTIIPLESLLTQIEKIRWRRVLILENAGHMGFYEEPKACIKAIAGFAGMAHRTVSLK